MTTPRVAVLMGSISDLDVMIHGVRVLEDLGMPHEVRVLSAHRSPDTVADYARTAADRGLRVLIAGAGGAAHLAGALAAHSALPVLGVPLVASSLDGLDSLLATVQMPGGVPVGTLGVGKSGVVNAAHLAARILALSDEGIAERVRNDRKSQVKRVERHNEELAGRLEEEGLDGD